MKAVLGALSFGVTVYVVSGDIARAVAAAVAFGVGFVYARMGDGREVSE